MATNLLIFTSKSKTQKAISISFIALLTLFPTLVFGDDSCGTGAEDHNKGLALKYKYSAIASIFLASLIGVCIPILGKNTVPALSTESNLFFVVKSFAAGVILATGFIHVLPDAFESLTSPCLPENPWGNFPFTGFVAMVASIGTLMVDVYATSHYRNKSGEKSNQAVVAVAEDADGVVLPLHTHATHGHAHGSVPADSVTTQLRYRVISQVLELGIIVHSVIIGIALGANNSPKTIKPLLAALTFHQFFEGIGLGGCITQAKFKVQAIVVMAIFFSLTTPVGIAIGIGIANVYNEKSPNALIVQGVFDSASAGILIYMALVDLLSADFMNPKLQNNGKLQIGCNISLLFGAGCMSLLAKWA
ncbi:OLC1v1025252C1 [Oldenlandia corymbosa var. corymbosa]|uniref:OLC1v1025252C1 n=1 Tax=Oldenlandia corymbosa var. corymbosa TaxID=529605 RepID=A0AAV1C742_OLDCO|nr:OLC1v1025252C1 [Oldenlandia corymbosa var. corymbosa]